MKRMPPVSLTAPSPAGTVNRVDEMCNEVHADAHLVNQVDEGVDMAVVPAPTAPTHELGEARFTSLATPSRGSSETSVWLVAIAPGAAGVPHRLTREEVFVVLSGRPRVSLAGEESSAAAGDAIVVPPGVPFALAPDGEEQLRALCCLPVGGQGQLADGEPF